VKNKFDENPKSYGFGFFIQECSVRTEFLWMAYNYARNRRNIMSTKSFQLTAVIEREDDWFVATCPEVDVVSQGKNIEDARSNLLEAVELFFEMASPSEIKRRLKKETYVMPLMPIVPNLKAKPSTRA
jgi:predicted RNase H-like HicB family nuclease